MDRRCSAALLGVLLGAGGLFVGCDSTREVRPSTRNLAVAPAVLPAYDGAGNFANPYRKYGEWHNALVDVALRGYTSARRSGRNPSQAEDAAEAAASTLFRENFQMSDSAVRVHYGAGAQLGRKYAATGYRDFAHDDDVEGLLPVAQAKGAVSPVEARYLRRLAAIGAAANNADELSFALQSFDRRAYAELGPERSSLVLIPSAILRASAGFWTAQAIRGLTLASPSADAGPPVRAMVACDEECGGGGTSPPDSSAFYPSADRSYYADAYGDTIYVVRVDTVFVKTATGPSWTGFWLTDAAGGAFGGTAALVSGCGELTLGVCAGVVGLLGALGTSSVYAIGEAVSSGGGGGSGSGGGGGCPSGSYAWYSQGGVSCKPYPSSVQ